MKPCSSKRRLVAWLALGELDARRAQTIRAHIQTCDGCRRYLEQVSSVKETLTSAPGMPNIETSESFHRRVVARLGPGQSLSLWDRLVGRFGEAAPGWRAALGLAGATAVLIALVALLRKPPEPTAPGATIAPTRVAVRPNAALLPTISNYEWAANRSVDELDDLLTRQARERPSPRVLYTASMVGAD